MLGFGPHECPYRVAAAGRRWQLRTYAAPGSGPVLLVVSSPIKRPYIWDLAPTRSAVRYCLRRGLRVHLLEWTPASRRDGNCGLAEYVDEGLGEAVAVLSRQSGETRPFLIGHSLGGTFAAIFSALERDRIRGLVLLATPLCFAPGTSGFRDSLVKISPSGLSHVTVVPGSLLSQISAVAAPMTFVWSRLADGAISSATDPDAASVCARVERWALDEVPLPGQLVDQILRWLYREDRFCAGTLRVGDRTVGSSGIRVPTLMVVNLHDEIAPPRSVTPVADARPGPEIRLIEHSGECGVGLQHLAILVGRQAHAYVWPQIVNWIEQAAGTRADDAPATSAGG